MKTLSLLTATVLFSTILTAAMAQEKTELDSSASEFSKAFPRALPDFKITVSGDKYFEGSLEDTLTLSTIADRKTITNAAYHTVRFDKVNSIAPYKYITLSVCDLASFNKKDQQPNCIELEKPDERKIQISYVATNGRGGYDVPTFSLSYKSSTAVVSFSLRKVVLKALEAKMNISNAVVRVQTFARSKYVLSNVNKDYGVYGYLQIKPWYLEDVVTSNPVSNGNMVYALESEQVFDPFQLNIYAPAKNKSLTVSTEYISYDVEKYSDFNVPNNLLAKTMINQILKRPSESVVRVVDYLALAVMYYATAHDKGWDALKGKSFLKIDWEDPALSKLLSQPIVEQVTKKLPSGADDKLGLLAQYVVFMANIRDSIRWESQGYYEKESQRTGIASVVEAPPASFAYYGQGQAMGYQEKLARYQYYRTLAVQAVGAASAVSAGADSWLNSVLR